MGPQNSEGSVLMGKPQKPPHGRLLLGKEGKVFFGRIFYCGMKPSKMEGTPWVSRERMRAGSRTVQLTSWTP